MYRIELTEDAASDLAAMRKFDQVRIVDAMESQLVHEPVNENRHRKRLRLNRLAEWVLRVGEFRIFYNVRSESESVAVVAIGHKTGNDLYIRGEKFEL